MPRNPPNDPKLAKREAALRANLGRRKAQERAREDADKIIHPDLAEVIEPGPESD